MEMFTIHVAVYQMVERVDQFIMFPPKKKYPLRTMKKCASNSSNRPLAVPHSLWPTADTKAVGS